MLEIIQYIFYSLGEFPPCEVIPENVGISVRLTAHSPQRQKYYIQRDEERTGIYFVTGAIKFDMPFSSIFYIEELMNT